MVLGYFVSPVFLSFFGILLVFIPVEVIVPSDEVVPPVDVVDVPVEEEPLRDAPTHAFFIADVS